MSLYLKCRTIDHVQLYSFCFSKISFYGLQAFANAYIRGTSHYGRGVERTLYKLPSRQKGRSPIKYTNCRVCISLEIKFCLLKESLAFHKYLGQIFFHRTNTYRQNLQKVLPYRHSGVHCPLVVGL
jgi:hypothetical protein